MRTEKHEAKKRELIDSAFQTWGKCRFQNTSLAELASVHDMTKQAIYRYFPSKAKLEDAMEEIALDLFERATTEIKTALRESSSEDFADVFVQKTNDLMKKYGQYVLFLSYRYRHDSTGPPQMQSYLNDLNEIAATHADIPEVAMRYLSAVTMIEAHGKKPGGWKKAWSKGFVQGSLTPPPQFEILLADAGRLDYSPFAEDPLIRAVFEAVMEEAGNQVSLGKVAKKAGLTKSSLYNYWPSKEDMLSDVLNRQVTVFATMFDQYASAYPEPSDKLFAYLAFTGSFFRRTPEVLNYMQRVMSFGIQPPKETIMSGSGFYESLGTVINTGILNLDNYDPIKFLGLTNMAAVNEIKHHLVEGSARIRIDQCLKDLYLLISGGIDALRRTT